MTYPDDARPLRADYADYEAFARGLADPVVTYLWPLDLPPREEPLAAATVAGSELANLLVHPEHRGVGMGSALVRYIQRHHAALALTCRAGLIPWYQRLGFSVVRGDHLSATLHWERP